MQVNSSDVIYKWSCKFLYKPFLRHSRPLVCMVCDVRKWCRKKEVTNGHVKFRPSVHITQRWLIILWHISPCLYFNDGHKSLYIFDIPCMNAVVSPHQWPRIFFNDHFTCCSKNDFDSVHKLSSFSCTLYCLVYEGGKRINAYKHQHWPCEKCAWVWTWCR